MIVLMLSRVFSSVHATTRGRQRERHHCQCREKRPAWASPRCQKSHLLGASPLLIPVLLPSIPNAHDWPLEEVRGRTWGNRWHIQMWSSHRQVAEQLDKGEPATWLMPGSGKKGQRPILWAAHVIIPGLMNKHVSCTTWHWRLTSKHCPGTGGGCWGEVGVLGSCFGSSVRTSISREAAPPTLGALQRFLKVMLPSTAVT